MNRTVPETVRELCLSFPGSHETLNHSNPDFKVKGKTFAYFLINHHGDGRVDGRRDEEDAKDGSIEANAKLQENQRPERLLGLK